MNLYFSDPDRLPTYTKLAFTSELHAIEFTLGRKEVCVTCSAFSASTACNSSGLRASRALTDSAAVSP